MEVVAVRRKKANGAKKNANCGGRSKILPPESTVMSAEPGDRETAEQMATKDRKYSGITSLSYTEFLLSAKDHLREKSMLYSALITYENRLLRCLENEKDEAEGSGSCGELYKTYSHLGNVHLLALDYARAISAFQMAYRHSGGRFWQNAANLYGLGVCFFHFRIFRPCIQLFNQFVYCYPFNPKATEVHARLGFANKCIGDYQQANRHLNIALNDKNELRIFPHSLIKLHIAHCYDLFGEFPRAKQRYLELVKDAKNLPDDLVAAAYRQLGWIKFQEPFTDETKNKAKCFEEAEVLISRAVERGRCGRSICYLGRVVAQRARLEGASAAFDKFRQVIDLDADANTWFGIGQLYLQQHQPLDALQVMSL
ncbi:Histone demethylase UTY [Aphelenchoides besseyi]|nr:Histone demethylase UTY [Aphelenchoides besseyi]